MCDGPQHENDSEHGADDSDWKNLRKTDRTFGDLSRTRLRDIPSESLMTDPYANRSGYIITETCLQHRQRMVAQQPAESLTSPVETTLFVFSRHPPADQWTTRIGGLPAWPERCPWPHCSECSEPLAFAAQLDFRQSALADFVPGDTLVIHYCFSCGPWWKGKGDHLLTWQSASDEPLVEEAIVPVDIEGDEPGPCYGTPVSVIDYARHSEGEFGIQTLLATKIGGHPPDVQPEMCPQDCEGHDVRFLGSIGSLIAADVPRVPETPAVGDLNWADAGVISFWGAKKGTEFETLWELSSY